MSAHQAIDKLRARLTTRVLGQADLVERLLIALLADGHLLVEGPPGVAKTRAIKALAELIDCEFQRVQFTPDLLPADLTGTEVYRPQEGSFKFQPGPLFHNLVLADEVNRAPAKVQSALLEAMAEQQITVGHDSYPLPELFLVMATQNPIEQEGTYPLPEAQLDRFLMHVRVDYPGAEHEREVLRLVRDEARRTAREGGREKLAIVEAVPAERVSVQRVLAARREVLAIHVADNIEDYMVRLVGASRDPSRYEIGDEQRLARWLAWGASPRGTLALDAASRARAWLAGRDYVSPDDVQSVAHDCLRHRLLLSYEAEAEAVDTDAAIDALLNRVAVP